MDQFYHQKPGISSWQFWLQLSISVLIISWHDQYIDCVLLAALSPPAVRLAIGPMIVESLSKTREFRIKYGVISVIQWILVRSKIWKREVEELLKQHNVRIDHVTIQSELRHLIAAIVAGTIQWKSSRVSTPPKNHGFMSCPGDNPALVTQIRLLGSFRPWPRPSVRFEPSRKLGIPGPSLTLGTVTSILAQQGGQQFDYGSMLLHSHLIILDARTKIVDAQLTLISTR